MGTLSKLFSVYLGIHRVLMGWKSFFIISRHRMNILIITDELMLLLFSNHLTVSLARDKQYRQMYCGPSSSERHCGTYKKCCD